MLLKQPDIDTGLPVNKLKALVNHIPGAIYRCRGDEFFSIEFFSDEIEKLTGYPVQYFMDNRRDGYSRLVHPEDIASFIAAEQYALANKEKFEIEYRIIQHDGNIRWVFECGKGVYDDDDKISYVDGCIFDIDQRKRTEMALARTREEIKTQRQHTLKEQEELLQRLTLATDSAQIGIFEIDLSTGNVIWDERMYELYGCSKNKNQNLYKIFFDSLHPDDKPMMQQTIDDLLSMKKEIDGAVYRIILPDGRIRHVESHAIIKKSESGKIISLIGTNRDVTEDILVHEKIRMQNKVLRDIAFIQSHEVRKPLANILGIIEVLKNTGGVTELEIFEHLIESAHELDQQIRMIVSKTNSIDDELFR